METEKIDIHDYKRQIDNEIKLIERDCLKVNQKLILDYDQRYSVKLGLSDARRTIILNKLKLIEKRIKKPLAGVTPKDIEDFELSIIKKGLAERSKKGLSKRSQKDYRDIIKQFYKWVDNEEGERWKWIQKNFKNHKVPPKTYKPEDFMNEEERQIFLQSAKNIFEQSLASVFLTSGCRCGEIGNMTVGSFQHFPEEIGKTPDETIDEHCIIEVAGKTGERRIKLYNPTAAYLKEFIKQHPKRHDTTAPFWINNLGNAYTYDGIATVLRRIGIESGIKKPFNPHSFRHMTYTLFQLKGVPQAVREKYFGHIAGSAMSKIYTHISDEEVFDALDEMHGKVRKRRNVKLEVQMKQCSKCLKTFLPDKSFCDECGLSLEKSVLEEQEQRKTKEELAKTVIELKNSFAEMQKEVQEQKQKIEAQRERIEKHYKKTTEKITAIKASS